MLNTNKRPAKLHKRMNVRFENHGSEAVPACDIHADFAVGSDMLDEIEPGLKAMLYRQPEAGDQMELTTEAAKAFTVLKHPGLEPIVLKGKFPGYEIEVSDPNDEQPQAAPFFMVDVTLKKITVEAKDGGTAVITVTAQFLVDEDELAGCLSLLKVQDVLLTLTPPKPNAALAQPVPEAKGTQDAASASLPLH